MRRTLTVFTILAILALLLPTPARADETAPTAAEPYAGSPLCLPDVHLAQGDCLALGPSAYLTDMAKIGLTFPPRPLPAVSPDPGLVQAPISYARIGLDESVLAPIFSSLEDAVAGTNPTGYIDRGFLRYISYIRQVDEGNGHYLQLPSGGWMRASPAAYSRFQGLVFTDTPRNGFGWMIDHTKSRVAPGYGAAFTNHQLYRGDSVQVYQIEKKDGVDWYMIGPDEWIERRYIRAITPATHAPEGVDNGRWIDLNLYEQILAIYDNNRLVFATLMASGLDPFFTKPGLFKIYKMKELETMTGAFEPDRSDYYYLEDVPWTIYYDEARAIHGAYWRTWFGVPQSHGCVNLSTGDAHWVYDWAKEGDWVYVYDPSGETPTDPSRYGAGGA